MILTLNFELTNQNAPETSTTICRVVWLESSSTVKRMATTSQQQPAVSKMYSQWRYEMYSKKN